VTGDGLEPRPASASRTTLSQVMSVLDTNLLGTVHGGVVMKLVDEVAGVVATRHSGGPAVTAAMDEMVFVTPVRVGDLVHVHAQVNWTGRTSMEVGVRATAQRWDRAGEATLRVATAYLAFVAVDEHGDPRPVPPVLPETDEDRRRWREAEIRRRHRLARREEIRSSRAEPG
jgi:acyl-CoA hydrolase